VTPLPVRAEYLNVWREDLSDFVPVDVLETCTDFAVHERPPQPGITYTAFCDAAGGTDSDSFTLAVAHYDKAHETVIMDLCRERAPRFVPAAVIAEFAQLLKLYRISSVMGDSFAGGFHADEWTRNGITFRSYPRTTSENYLHALPLLLSGRVQLIDSSKLRAQLASLERHVLAGREVVRHPAGGFCSRRHRCRRRWCDRGGKTGCGGAGSADRDADYHQRHGTIRDPTDAGLTTTQKFYKYFAETPWRPYW